MNTHKGLLALENILMATLTILLVTVYVINF